MTALGVMSVSMLSMFALFGIACYWLGRCRIRPRHVELTSGDAARWAMEGRKVCAWFDLSGRLTSSRNTQQSDTVPTSPRPAEPVLIVAFDADGAFQQADIYFDFAGERRTISVASNQDGLAYGDGVTTHQF